jgi:hypothetical protein
MFSFSFMEEIIIARELKNILSNSDVAVIIYYYYYFSSLSLSLSFFFGGGWALSEIRFDSTVDVLTPLILHKRGFLNI